MKRLGRPPGAIKRITVSSHIKQDTFVVLAKHASKTHKSISRVISDILDDPIAFGQLAKECGQVPSQPPPA